MKKWSESVGKKQEINGKKLQNGVFNVSFDRFQASIPFSSPLKIFDFLMCSWGIRREYWFGKSLVSIRKFERVSNIFGKVIVIIASGIC